MAPTLPPKKRPYHEDSYIPSYPDWDKGECLIIGGGPSLRDMSWGEIQGWRDLRPNRYVIAVNNACLSIMPRADIAYWVDARWYQWNAENLTASCRAKKRYTSAHGASVDKGGGTYIENRNGEAMFSTDPKFVCGRDSGGIAINIAYHCNAGRVYLIGFDMWDTPAGTDTGNFHEDHKLKQAGTPRSSHFIPAHTQAASTIIRKELKFKVFNATPYSALHCWTPTLWKTIQ